MKITLENFKGFKNPVELDLAKINLFVGANSSGKSTLRKFFSFLKPFNGDVNFGLKDLSGAARDSNADFLSLVNKQSELKTFKLFFSDVEYCFGERMELSYGGVKYSHGKLVSTTYKPYGRELFKFHHDSDVNDSKVRIDIAYLIELLNDPEFVRQDDYEAHFHVSLDFDLEASKLKAINDIIEISDSYIFFYEHYRFERQSFVGHLDLKKYMEDHGLDPISYAFERLLLIVFLKKMSVIMPLKESFCYIDSSDVWLESKDRYFDFYGKYKTPDDFKMFLKDQYNLEIRVLNVEDENRKKYGHKIQVKQHGQWYYLNEIGDGSRKLVTLISNLESFLSEPPDSFDYTPIIFFEELENQLHPDLEIFLFDYLLNRVVKNGKNNIVLETHSLNLLRAVQLAVAEGRIDLKDVRIYDFSLDQDEGVVAIPIPICPNGLLDCEFKSGFADSSRQMELRLWQIQHLHNSKN